MKEVHTLLFLLRLNHIRDWSDRVDKLSSSGMGVILGAQTQGEVVFIK